MSESLASRVGRIISGGAHALVEAVENMSPEMVMEQAIREIDGAIDEVRAELGRVAANKHLANKRLVEENRKHEDLAGKIDLAVEEGRDDLAEAAISQQLDIEAQIPILEGTIREAGEREKELEGFIVALQAKKREMRGELKDFRESREAQVAASGDGGGAADRHSVDRKVDRAESAFDRILDRHTGVGSAAGRQGGENAAKLAELEEMSRSHRIEERLAAAKARAEDGK